MTISLKTRVPKLTEDDIILNLPLPAQPENITWTWRLKGFRAVDIIDVEMLDKKSSIVTYWDAFNEEPKRIVVKEPFDQIMLKWEIAETSNVVFEDELEDEKTEDSSNGEDEED